MNKNKKEVTEKDMEIIEKQIDAINIKMINWKHEILNTIFQTRNILIILFAILIIGIIIVIVV
tara:strand:+ start:648 stop:836 length:189 start_codon:yes stop_codon:yes gene_type:complete